MLGQVPSQILGVVSGAVVRDDDLTLVEYVLTDSAFYCETNKRFMIICRHYHREFLVRLKARCVNRGDEKASAALRLLRLIVD